MCRTTRRRAIQNLVSILSVLLASTAGMAAARAAGTPAVEAPATPGLITYDTKIACDVDDEEARASAASASLLLTLKDEPLDAMGALFERARKDRDRVQRALNALGYFAAGVVVTIEGNPADDLEAEDRLSATPPDRALAVEIRITRGPLFKLGKVAVEGVPSDLQDPELQDSLSLRKLGLEPGTAARSAGIIAANARITSALRQAGYPFAAISKRTAVADHASATLDVTLIVTPGPKAKMGQVEIKGTEKVNPQFVAGLAPFASGDEFQASLLKDFREEIERLNVFDAITLDEAGALDDTGRLPLTVNVHERPRHLLGVSASWSTFDGAALAAYWEHRNLFGEAEHLRFEATSSRLFLNATQDYEYALSGTLTFPAFPQAKDDVIVKLGALRERPDAFSRDAIEFSAGWKRRFDKTLSLEAGVAFADAREEDALGKRDRTTVSLPVTVVYDDRNNPLEPVTGLRASAEVRPIASLNGTGDLAARVFAQASAYARLDDDASTVLAGRLATGFTLASNLIDLPTDLRFFSGGGGSVRGYPYQHLSPRNALDQITGGRSLIEGSVEVRHWIWEDIGVAAFADAGGAFTSNFPDFNDLGAGVGVGVRYRTAVGPVRLDAAIPLDPRGTDSSFAVYVGLGQAF